VQEEIERVLRREPTLIQKFATICSDGGMRLGAATPPRRANAPPAAGVRGPAAPAPVRAAPVPAPPAAAPVRAAPIPAPPAAAPVQAPVPAPPTRAPVQAAPAPAPVRTAPAAPAPAQPAPAPVEPRAAGPWVVPYVLVWISGWHNWPIMLALGMGIAEVNTADAK